MVSLHLQASFFLSPRPGAVISVQRTFGVEVLVKVISRLFPFGRHYRELVRARQIAQILAKNGLGFLIEQFGLTRFLLGRWQQFSSMDRNVAQLNVPQRIRRTLEELGPTFIKLGQLLSGRGDLLPPEYVHELVKLLDAAPPVPADQIRQVMEKELGAPVERLFATFQDEPIASASIGQVHRASLPGGEQVVVKVQRPGVENVIKADLGILLHQARFLENRSELLREYRLVEIVEELARTLCDELDYTIEGRNAERFRYNLRHDERLIIPRIYWPLTSRRVITMEDVGGIKLTELERLRAEGYDLAAVAAIGVEVYLEQVFVDGFFHADPHPANIMVVEDKIALVDFGMV